MSDCCKEIPKYIGVKIIRAYPAPAPQDVKGDNKPGDEGYNVIYDNGYESWSPVKAFEDAYRLTDGMPFGLAIEAMKKGEKVARKGWNGKGMFIFLTEGREIPNNKERSFIHFGGETVVLGSHIDMKAVDGTYISGWLASQTDMLSDDWMIVK